MHFRNQSFSFNRRRKDKNIPIVANDKIPANMKYPTDTPFRSMMIVKRANSKSLNNVPIDLKKLNTLPIK